MAGTLMNGSERELHWLAPARSTSMNLSILLALALAVFILILSVLNFVSPPTPVEAATGGLPPPSTNIVDRGAEPRPVGEMQPMEPSPPDAQALVAGRWAARQQSCEFAIILSVESGNLLVRGPDGVTHARYQIQQVTAETLTVMRDGRTVIFEINNDTMEYNERGVRSWFSRCVG